MRPTGPNHLRYTAQAVELSDKGAKLLLGQSAEALEQTAGKNPRQNRERQHSGGRGPARRAKALIRKGNIMAGKSSKRGARREAQQEDAQPADERGERVGGY